MDEFSKLCHTLRCTTPSQLKRPDLAPYYTFHPGDIFGKFAWQSKPRRVNGLEPVLNCIAAITLTTSDLRNWKGVCLNGVSLLAFQNARDSYALIADTRRTFFPKEIDPLIYQECDRCLYFDWKPQTQREYEAKGYIKKSLMRNKSLPRCLLSNSEAFYVYYLSEEFISDKFAALLFTLPGYNEYFEFEEWSICESWNEILPNILSYK
jgi:hypothetical protein